MVDVSPHTYTSTLIYHQKRGLDEDIMAAYSVSSNPQLIRWSSLNPHSTILSICLEDLNIGPCRRQICISLSHLPDLLTKCSSEAGLMSNSVLCSYTILYTVGTLE